MSTSRGAALVLVLWLLLLLTTVVGAFALTARVEYLQGRVSAERAVMQEVARAGMEYALARVHGAGTAPRWHADGREYRWTFAGQPVLLQVVDEAGKVDLNAADPALLERVLRALPVESSRATALAAAIVDWRDPDTLTSVGGAEDPDYAAAGLPYGAKDAPFDSLAELQRLPGVDEELYQRLRPLVTVFSRRPRPEPGFAPGPVLTALGLDAAAVLAKRQSGALPAAGVDGAIAAGSGTYGVVSQVLGARGRGVRLAAVVRMEPAAATGTTYSILAWEQGASSQ